MYGVTRDVYWSALVVSLVCYVATLWLVARRLAASAAAGVLGIALLCGSNAFAEFSTSGLENPLTHVLLALFWLELWHGEHRRFRALRLTLLVALLALNRLDAVLLIARPQRWPCGISAYGPRCEKSFWHRAARALETFSLV
jgi:arabinofuranosyltransferase